MENFAAGTLYLVAPQVDPLCEQALRRSKHGARRLRQARVVATLPEALTGAGYAVATSRQIGPVHQATPLLPRSLVPHLLDRRPEGDVALLFGSEDNGLARQELLACDALLQIPAQPAYPTLNLSHAVAICLYEAFVTLGTPDQTTTDIRHPVEPADAALLCRLMDKLQHSLLRIGYLHPEKPDHLMFPIRSILSRANLTRTEARILIGLAQQIEDFARHGRPHHPPPKEP